MIGESLAIILVIGITAVMYLRAGKREMTFLCLPLTVVPVIYLIGYALYTPVQSIVLISLPVWAVAVSLTGLLLALAGTVMTGRYIIRPNMRRAYLVLSWIFSAALALAYIIRYI